MSETAFRAQANLISISYYAITFLPTARLVSGRLPTPPFNCLSTQEKDSEEPTTTPTDAK
eukprot:5316595-Amphidinium_carterae.1